MVLGFRLYFTKDSTTINTAGATVRQLVTVVYERVVTEDRIPSQQPLESFSKEKLKSPSKNPPESLRPCAQDGFLLFQVESYPFYSTYYIRSVKCILSILWKETATFVSFRLDTFTASMYVILSSLETINEEAVYLNCLFWITLVVVLIWLIVTDIYGIFLLFI